MKLNLLCFNSENIMKVLSLSRRLMKQVLITSKDYLSHAIMDAALSFQKKNQVLCITFAIFFYFFLYAYF